MQHKLSHYIDDFKKIEFCKVCGVENPTGECSGEFIAQKVEDKSVDKKQEQH